MAPVAGIRRISDSQNVFVVRERQTKSKGKTAMKRIRNHYNYISGETAEMMFREYQKDTDAFLKDEFKRELMAKVLNEIAQVAWYVRSADRQGVTYGNGKRSERLSVDANNIRNGNRPYMCERWTGGFIGVARHLIDTVNFELENNMLHIKQHNYREKGEPFHTLHCVSWPEGKFPDHFEKREVPTYEQEEQV
jgi:hypothetical protein